MRCVILAVLVACSAPAKPTAPPKTGPTCGDAAAHMVDEMAATQETRPPDEALNSLIDLIRKRCEADRWTPEAVACLSRIKSAADADQCGTLLTEAQQAALVQDQSKRSK